MHSTLDEISTPLEPLFPCAEIDAFEWEDDSPYGLQGFHRGHLHVLKDDCIGKLAATLAMVGTPEQIRRDDFVHQVLRRNADWADHYRIVHLIEKSLWITGHSDLVMRMTRNPHQILDHPPPEILKVLTEACVRHPDATIWYGVPLFSEEHNAEGLPIPLTAQQVETEARARIASAQQHALRWHSTYRAMYRACTWPTQVWQAGAGVVQRLRHTAARARATWLQARYDARIRTRAAIRAQLERCSYGESLTEIPKHTTTIGRLGQLAVETLFAVQSVAERSAPLAAGTAFGVSSFGLPALIATVAPSIASSLTLIAIDPFLMMELPTERGKLRHLGHWYWQEQANGSRKLHVHV